MGVAAAAAPTQTKIAKRTCEASTSRDFTAYSQVVSSEPRFSRGGHAVNYMVSGFNGAEVLEFRSSWLQKLVFRSPVSW